MRWIFGCAFVLLLAVGAGANRWVDLQESVVRHGITEDKIVAITVDDGPYPQATERILDVLRDEGIKATFFVLGRSAESYPDLVERTAKEGHEIATHGYSHRNMARMSAEECRQEWERAEKTLSARGIAKPTLFRPPSGAYGDTLVRTASACGYRVILWDVDPRDWEGASTDTIVKRITEQVKAGSIILLHDGQYPIHSAEALRIVIPRLKKEGYSFVTVSQMLGAVP